MRLLAILPILAWALSGCSPCSYRTASDGGRHYFDCNRQSQPQWDYIWDQLFAYFGSATPPAITIEHWNGSTNRFHPKTMSIELGPNGERVEVVAHESTHLCNYTLTRGASTTTSFRFVDEGFAEIMGYRIAGQADWYRTYALAVAKQEMEQGRVSLAQVQDWSTYFEGSAANARNWKAYQVGSSFDFLIEETKGADGLRAFFEDIGNTRNLGATVQNLFSLTADAIEAEWLAYLEKVEADRSAPMVTAMFPADSALDVPLNTTEITVTFNVPMGRASCLTIPCGENGLCPTRTYWKAPHVLGIDVNSKLKRGTPYSIGLGRDDCPMTSALGLPLPVSAWTFTTAQE